MSNVFSAVADIVDTPLRKHTLTGISVTVEGDGPRIQFDRIGHIELQFGGTGHADRLQQCLPDPYPDLIDESRRRLRGLR